MTNQDQSSDERGIDPRPNLNLKKALVRPTRGRRVASTDSAEFPLPKSPEFIIYDEVGEITPEMVEFLAEYPRRSGWLKPSTTPQITGPKSAVRHTTEEESDK